MADDPSYPLSGYDLCCGILDLSRDYTAQSTIKVDGLMTVTGSQETDWLEFKSACGPRCGEHEEEGTNIWDYRWHVAQAIIALANTNGGCLLLGVNDDGEAVGLTASDPKNLLTNQGIDAFLRFLDQAVIRPPSGWACQKAGIIRTAHPLPHDLCELIPGELEGEKIIIALVKPRPVARYIPEMTLPAKFECIHCIESRNGHFRDLVPVRTLGAVGNCRCLWALEEWIEWEKTRSLESSQYSVILSNYKASLKTDDHILLGEWSGVYFENHSQIPFKLEITSAVVRERLDESVVLVSGVCEEPAMGRRFAGPNSEKLHAKIDGSYNPSQKSLILKKTYQGNIRHIIEYEGNVSIAADGMKYIKGVWLNDTVWKKFVRRGGNFEMQKDGPLKKELPLVLVTGFEPFGLLRVNPSFRIAERIRDQERSRIDAFVHSEILPVDYVKARVKLEETLKRLRPVLWIGLGAARRISDCRVETRARVPRKFAEDAPEELQGTWPFDELVETLNSNGVLAQASSEAGEFVCEAVYWALLNFSRLNEFPVEACFIHVPSQISPQLLDSIASGIAMAIQARISARSPEFKV